MNNDRDDFKRCTECGRIFRVRMRYQEFCMICYSRMIREYDVYLKDCIDHTMLEKLLYEERKENGEKTFSELLEKYGKENVA